MAKLSVLMVSSECFPFARTGGLAEVVPSLAENTGKVKGEELKVSVIIPFYGAIGDNFPESGKFIKENFSSVIEIGDRLYSGDLFSYGYNGFRIFFVKNDHFFARSGIYGNENGDYNDNAERFYFFSRFVVEIVKKGFLDPDIVHVHDWHASLIPAMLKSSFKDVPEINKKLKKIKSLLTIHNLGYQGILKAAVTRWAGFDLKDFPDDIFGRLSKDGDRLNFLKTGIVFSDKINTVSPSYADEIKGVKFGFGLDKLLKMRSDDLSGILNGANYKRWNPEIDNMIPQNFSSKDLSGKVACKKGLSDFFGFDYEPEVPIIGVIARLSYQKGLDLLTSVWDEFRNLEMKFVLLGDGDRELETFFLSNAREFSKKIGVRVEFDIALSHLIQAGSDMFLMPSRYEPCGLAQLHAMKYGTIPVVRNTGGLKDTVERVDNAGKRGNGFKFEKIDSLEMIEVVKRAISLYKNKKVWNKIMLRAMKKDFSYEVASKKYIELYKSLVRDS